MKAIATKSHEYLEKSKKSYLKSLSLYENMEFDAFTDMMYDTCFTATQSLICLVKQKDLTEHSEVSSFVKSDLVQRKYIGDFLYELYTLMGAHSKKLPSAADDRMSELGDVDLVKDNAELYLEVIYKLIISLSGERVAV